MSKPVQSKDLKVSLLAKRLAGDKWEQVTNAANADAINTGKSYNKALADALETFKCPNTL
jgi:hypothetical protein